jgi:hypothetical protein
MIDQVVWLIANAAGESNKLKEMVLSQTYIVETLARIIIEAQ